MPTLHGPRTTVAASAVISATAARASVTADFIRSRRVMFAADYPFESADEAAEKLRRYGRLPPAGGEA